MTPTTAVVEKAIEILEDHYILTDEMDTALLRHIKSLKDERKRLRDALESIEEYWNGGEASAVDAAEEMRYRAQQALSPAGENGGKVHEF